MTKRIRIGLLGLGERGLKTLQRYSYIEDVKILAIADIDQTKVLRAKKYLAKLNKEIDFIYFGYDAWREIALNPNIDLLYICTDWYTHAKFSIFAMNNGKNVAVEVPIATTVNECWEILETVEKTKKHCFMAENCCYDKFALGILEMKRLGLLGKVTHCEGAYIHQLLNETRGNIETVLSEWMKNSMMNHNGNPYPTHAIGPLAWLLNIHRGDRFDFLISLSSEIEGTNHKVNTTIIKTVKGATILLKFDVFTPRPYNRIFSLSSSNVYVQKYPNPTISLNNELLENDEATEYLNTIMSSHPSYLWEQGQKLGVENPMNYAMDCRLIYCLKNNLPLDIDIYDALEWSCIAELSELSAKQGGVPIKIPDFTKGKWKTIPKHKFHYGKM